MNTKIRTRRDEIYEFICTYANAHHGPTPSIREVAIHFRLNYTTVYRHIQRLMSENRLDMRNGKLVVMDARWFPPEKMASLFNTSQ